MWRQYVNSSTFDYTASAEACAATSATFECRSRRQRYLVSVAFVQIFFQVSHDGLTLPWDISLHPAYVAFYWCRDFGTNKQHSLHLSSPVMFPSYGVQDSVRYTSIWWKRMCLQLINLIFWLTPLLYISKHNCQYMSRLVNGCTYIRWSAWNTVIPSHSYPCSLKWLLI